MNTLWSEMFNEAIKLEKTENWDGALELYEEIIRENPNHFESTLNLGTILFKKGLVQEAIRCYEQAILLKKDLRALYNLGLVYYKSRSFDLALKYLSECIQMDAAFIPATLLTGYLLTEQNKPDQAIKVLKDGLLIHKENESLLICLAIVYQTCKNNILCECVIDEILAKNPDNTAALRLRARLSAAGPITSEAIENFRALIKGEPVLIEIESLMEKSENQIIKENVSRIKNDISSKSTKTSHDYFDLSLISFITGNGNAAMNYLLYAVKNQ